jgi:hypothetical protein
VLQLAGRLPEAADALNQAADRYAAKGNLAMLERTRRLLAEG